jgi:hypothetical protein
MDFEQWQTVNDAECAGKVPEGFRGGGLDREVGRKVSRMMRCPRRAA